MSTKDCNTLQFLTDRIAEAIEWNPNKTPNEIATNQHAITWETWHVIITDHPPPGTSEYESIVALGTLPNGQWVTFEGWADYTGWGCQHRLDWVIRDTRHQAVRQGLTNEGRDRLGITLEAQ